MTTPTSAHYRFETRQLHTGQDSDSLATDARAVPIYATAAYQFQDFDHAEARFALTDAGNIYGRLTNSTQSVLEQRLASLEGGTAALAVASGAAAITYAIRTITGNGDHIVSSRTIYGGTYNLFRHTLPRDGVTTSFVDIDDLNAVEHAITPATKLVFLETFGNPNADLPDIEAISDIAHRHGVPVIADNTFATPYLFRPLEHGADIVVESATKFIGGHGTTLGGVIVENGQFDWTAEPGRFPSLSEADPSYHGLCFAETFGTAAFTTRARAVLLRDTGAAISPFAAFLLLQGTETLSLRVERHVSNTVRVIDYLRSVPEVEKISHPCIEGRADHERYRKYFPNGGGSIFTIDIRGGKSAARTFIDNLHLFSVVANVADAKSLVIHPASTTHAQLNNQELAEQGIKPGTVRLSIGLEHIDDLIADLDNAFASVRAQVSNASC